MGVVALEGLHVDLDAVREQLEKIVRPGLPTSHADPVTTAQEAQGFLAWTSVRQKE